MEKKNNLSIHGHRGSRGTHPENTIPSFLEAFEAGAEYVELDVHLSKDAHVIVYHDFQVTGSICTKQTGEPLSKPLWIEDLSLDEIKSFECGNIQNPRFPSQKTIASLQIPTLDELFRWKNIHAPTLKLNIEIKRDINLSRRSSQELAVAVMKVIHKNHGNESLVQSFDWSVVAAVRNIDEDIRLSCLFEEMDDFAEVTSAHGAQVAAPDFSLLNEHNIAECRSRNIQVLPWTVNQEKDWNHLIELGVNSIITDFPRKLKNFISV